MRTAIRKIRGSTVLAIAATASLAILTLPAIAQQPTSYRSANDVQTRIPDELDRPFWRETQSHRGWEIREDQYAVLANTSLEDARWAAAQVKQVWSNAASLADRWTAVHRQPDFGLGSTQIVIDSEPLRQRDAPLTTLAVVGSQTQVYLNVAPGQPTLKQQMLRLREAAGLALLHTAGLDAAVPGWVVQGLAVHAAEQGLDPVEVMAFRKVSIPGRPGGEQWRYKRSAQDVLDYPAAESTHAASCIQFLLVGNDAEHAPALLEEVRKASAVAKQSAARGGQFDAFPGDGKPEITETSFDRLLAEHRSQYEAWQSDPLAGQPVFTPEASVPLELLRAEQEMLVVLKLHRKLASKTSARRTTPRVTTFDRETGRQVVTSTRTFDAPATIHDLYRRLNDPALPAWATLDADGGLLLSSDRQRIEELIGRPGERYSLSKEGERFILVRQLEGGRLLQGWLAENPDHRSRPLAMFEVVDLRTRVKESGRSAITEARDDAAERKR